MVCLGLWKEAGEPEDNHSDKRRTFNVLTKRATDSVETPKLPWTQWTPPMGTQSVPRIAAGPDLTQMSWVFLTVATWWDMIGLKELASSTGSPLCERAVTILQAPPGWPRSWPSRLECHRLSGWPRRDSFQTRQCASPSYRLLDKVLENKSEALTLHQVSVGQ